MSEDLSGKIEPFWRKAIRHIRAGDFHSTTIQSGVVQFTHWLGSQGCEAGRIDNIQCIENFGNIEGLVVTRMPMRIFIEFMRLNEPSFVDFPTSSRLGIVVKGDNTDTAVSVPSSFQQSSGALAEFTGPTFGKHEDRINHLLPNNGFWLKGYPMTNPFREASEFSGQTRRGAFAIRANGGLKLVDDEGKHQIVHSNFRGYAALVGTSYFMSSNDNNEVVAKEKESSEISYLVLYESPDGV